MTRKALNIAALLIGVILALVWADSASAQTWPAKPLRLVVAFPAGGMIDIFARALQPRLAEAFGQPVIIDNRGGASGTLAEALVAKAAPDGYTLMMSADTAPANAHLFRNAGYDVFRDIAPVSMLVKVPLVLLVHPSFSSGSMTEFISQVHARNGKFAYGSTGTGTSNHLLMLFLSSATSTQMTHVPYKGGSQVMNDLIGGQIQATLISITLAAPQVRSGKARAIAITGDKRAVLLPQVPTFVESGFPDFPTGQWSGLFVPAGTPPALVQRIHAEFARAMRAPEVQVRFTELGAEPVMSSSAEFSAFLDSENQRLGKLIRDNNIRAD